MTYRIVPLPAEIASHVRSTRTDPTYGMEYNVMRSVAGPGGYGPCRQCLRKFDEGETRLLFLHNPFSTEQGDFAGPVFIHDEACEESAPSARFPDQLRGLPMFLRAYDPDGHFLSETVVRGPDMESLLARVFQDQRVSEVHIRNSEARCFIAKAVREH